mgnify:FL=1
MSLPIMKERAPRLRNYQVLCNLGESKRRGGWLTVAEIKKGLIKYSNLPVDRPVIRKVAQAMDIKGRDLNGVVESIWRKTKGEGTPIIHRLMRQLRITNEKSDGEKLVALLYQILYPESIRDRSKIDQDEYKKLITLQKSERDGPVVLTADQNKRLEAMMASKVCKCVKEQHLRHRFRYLVLNISPEGVPPEAICQWSIFNQRGMKGFDLTGCDKRFSWYRTLKKVKAKSYPAFPPQTVKNSGKMLEG